MKVSAACVIAGLFALAACQTASPPPPAAVPGNKMLIKAGFTPRKATSSSQAATLGSLPPNVMVKQTVKGKVNYLYADPAGCNCVYVGDRAAFQNYKGMRNTMSEMNQDEPGALDPMAPGLAAGSIDDLGTWAPL